METYEGTIKALEVISTKIAKGGVCDAVALWRETMHDEGRCSNGCPFNVAPDSLTCAHCLTGKLMTVSLSFRHNSAEGDRYVEIARMVMDWINFTKESL